MISRSHIISKQPRNPTHEKSHPHRCSIVSSAGLFAAGILLLASCATEPIGTGKSEADYSNYDEPLHDQVVDHIEAKVMPAWEGRNDHDRYFIIPFAYQNSRNDPAFSHSFLSVRSSFGGRARQPSEFQVSPRVPTRAVNSRPE